MDQAFQSPATPVVAWDWEDGVDAYKVGDYQKAFRLWEPLPKRGHAKAQSNLGVMYSNGKGVTKDDAKAVYWRRKAAKHGLCLHTPLLGETHKF